MVTQELHSVFESLRERISMRKASLEISNSFVTERQRGGTLREAYRERHTKQHYVDVFEFY